MTSRQKGTRSLYITQCLQYADYNVCIDIFKPSSFQFLWKLHGMQHCQLNEHFELNYRIKWSQLMHSNDVRYVLCAYVNLRYLLTFEKIMCDETVVQSPWLFFLLSYFCVLLVWFFMYKPRCWMLNLLRQLVFTECYELVANVTLLMNKVCVEQLKQYNERTHANSIQMLNEIKYWFFPVVVAVAVAVDIFIGWLVPIFLFYSVQTLAVSGSP